MESYAFTVTYVDTLNDLQRKVTVFVDDSYADHMVKGLQLFERLYGNLVKTIVSVELDPFTKAPSSPMVAQAIRESQYVMASLIKVEKTSNHSTDGFDIHTVDGATIKVGALLAIDNVSHAFIYENRRGSNAIELLFYSPYNPY